MSSLSYKAFMRLNIYRNKNIDYYIESQKAIIKSGKITFQGAIPFKQSLLKEFAESIHQKDSFIRGYNVIPENVLYHSEYKICIYQPPCLRKLKFSKNLKIDNKIYPIPGLIFIFDGNGLSIYSYLDKNRPSDNTNLYKSPFYNINSNGNVCMGSNQMGNVRKLKSLYDMANTSIHLFFSSLFDHYLDTNRLYDLTLEDLYRKRKGIIPIKAYIPHGKTLGQQLSNTYSR